MTTNREEAARSGAPPRRAALAARLGEWLWRGRALRDAREARAASSLRLLWQRRARIAAEAGSYALAPASPWAHGPAFHVACGLFAESIACCLVLSQRASALESSRLPDSALDRPPSQAELVELVAAQRELLLEAAQDPAVLERVTRLLLQREFDQLTLPASDTGSAARELRLVAERLLQRLAEPTRAVERAIDQRVLRLGLLAALLLAAAWPIAELRERLEMRRDLAPGKAWVASSVYEQVCQSPAHHCAAQAGYFFHTQQDKSPWLEIDLGRSESFSAVRVFNRRDCCSERATPLVVEASTDHRSWRELARTTETFEEWKASFPAVSARWVRFRVTRRSHLHFYDVRVLR